MHKHFIFICLICSATFAGTPKLISQDLTLLSTAGGLASAFNLFLTYSIGEPCISYTENEGNWITEGFQQPGHLQIMVSTDPTGTTTDLIVYPNPTTSHVTISGMDLGTCVDLRLSNMLGQSEIETALTSGTSQKIDMDHLPSGLYVLTVRRTASSFFSQTILKL